MADILVIVTGEEELKATARAYRELLGRQIASDRMMAPNCVTIRTIDGNHVNIVVASQIFQFLVGQAYASWSATRGLSTNEMRVVGSCLRPIPEPCPYCGEALRFDRFANRWRCGRPKCPGRTKRSAIMSHGKDCRCPPTTPGSPTAPRRSKA